MLVHNWDVVKENLKRLEAETDEAYQERLDLYFEYEPESIIAGWEDGWNYFYRTWSTWRGIEVLYRNIDNIDHYKFIYNGKILYECTTTLPCKKYSDLLEVMLIQILDKESN